GDRYWLAPASEIDPWLGTWNPICSYFDQGDPPAPPPQDCDGIRSLTQSEVDQMDPIEHRIIVNDADLNGPNPTFWHYGMYVLTGEADALRDDTAASRQFVPSWNGSKWILSRQGSSVQGPIIENWTGSHYHSVANGNDDGRVFLASLPTGPD